MKTIFFNSIVTAIAMSAISAFSQDMAGVKYIKQNTDTVSLWNYSVVWKDRSESLKSAAGFAAVANGWIVRNEFPDGKLMEIRELKPDGKPVYFTTTNVNAAKTATTSKLWPGGGSGLNLTGVGMVIREWDGGKVRNNHNELSGRVTQVDGAATNSAHSTHVAGTMIAGGVDANAKGMAYQATLRAFEWTDDFSEMASEAAAGALVSNHSYGYITGWSYGSPYTGSWGWWGDPAISAVEDYGFGYYSADAQSVDQMAVSAPYYLICKSAGNDRTEGPAAGTSHYYYNGSAWVTSTATRNPDGNANGYDCISDWGLSKNILTVGAALDLPNGYGSPSDVVLDYFSGTGPCDDGRIKPDIVADGDYLYSCNSTNNSSYTVMSGTSMATPNACGSLILLQQYYVSLYSVYMRSATLKGLVIQTAEEAGTSPGPDYMHGWGLLSTVKAATVIRQKDKSSLMNEAILSNGGTYTLNVNATGNQPLKATICWTDPAGTPPPASLNPTTKMLVNDLDLRIDGTNYPWVLTRSAPSAAATNGDNSTDNVEQVLIASPSPGPHTITVTHKGSLSGGSQAFSIIVTGVYITVPDPVPFTAAATSSVETNLAWLRNLNNDNVMIAWSATGVFGTPVNGISYSAGNTIPGGGTVLYSGSATSFVHSSLTPITAYYYRAWSKTPANNYSCGVDAFATTLCTTTNTLPIIENFATSAFPCGWTQQVSGIGNTPDWTVSNSTIAGGSGYEMHAAYVNGAGPGYTTRLISLPFNSVGMTVVNLSFRHMFDDYGPGATIKVQSSSNGVTWVDEAWSAASGSGNIAATTVNTTITHNLDNPNTYISFVVTGDLYQYDNWYIDDVSIKVPGYWIGGASGSTTDWNTANNWGDQLVPTSLVDVYIPLRTYLPSINNAPGTPANCKNLIIGKDASVGVQSGKVLNINGNLIVR